MQMPSSWARTDAIATTRSHAVRHERHARAAVVLCSYRPPLRASPPTSTQKVHCGAAQRTPLGKAFGLLGWLTAQREAWTLNPSGFIYCALAPSAIPVARRPRVASICVELSQLHSTLSRGLPRTVRHSTAQNPNTAVESALVGWPRSGRPRPLQSSAASRSLTAAPHAHTHTPPVGVS